MIFAVVVIVWVAYVVPLLLRRYDEASSATSLASFSSLSRVIARPRRSADSSSSRPEKPADAPVAEKATEPEKAPRPVNRAAAKLAARRRRRVLITLLVTLVVVAGLGLGGVIGQAWTAIPVGLLTAWLVACRIQVRGELGLPSLRLPKMPRVSGRLSRSSTGSSTKRGGTAADEEATIVVSHQFEDVEPDRPRTMEKTPLEVNALDEQLQIAVPSVADTGEALWDPLPVTLPTYVTKPRVGRTVRTIDFAQSGTWTSGHVEAEGVELPGRAGGATAATSQDDDGQHQQAVGH